MWNKPDPCDVQVRRCAKAMLDAFGLEVDPHFLYRAAIICNAFEMLMLKLV